MARESVWPDRLAPLVQHRAWAKVGTYGTKNAAQVAASNLRLRKVPVPPGDWEWKVVQAATGVVLFGRFRG